MPVTVNTILRCPKCKSKCAASASSESYCYCRKGGVRMLPVGLSVDLAPTPPVTPSTVAPEGK